MLPKVKFVNNVAQQGERAAMFYIFHIIHVPWISPTLEIREKVQLRQTQNIFSTFEADPAHSKIFGT